MVTSIRPCFLGLYLVVGLTNTGFSSPLSSRLLPLVPPGAQIVAGFENYPEPHRHGQLLLTTHANRLDFADWQSIAGVDSQRSMHEVIEVAASSSSGALTEHLLLVEGIFNRERIFRSAVLNGAERSEFEGEPVLIVNPFTREKGDMVDARWLAIPDGRIGLLGTPSMVQRAIRRHALHADTDMVLKLRLSQLRPDVTSWNILATSPHGLNFLLHPGSRWAPLFEEVEVLTVAARFGSKVRVDFSAHAAQDAGEDFFRGKADSFAAVFASGLPDGVRNRPLKDVVFESNRVEGSIVMSMKQFESWGEQVCPPRISRATLSRGE